MNGISGRKLVAILVIVGTLLASCAGSSTGVLTGHIRFYGRVPKALLSQDSVVVLLEGTPVAQETLYFGRPYRFSLDPGTYTINLRGPSTVWWGNTVRVQVGQTSNLDLSAAFHG